MNPLCSKHPLHHGSRCSPTPQKKKLLVPMFLVAHVPKFSEAAPAAPGPGVSGPGQAGPVWHCP
eukprot:765006-Hanusia_phi.AAC.3